MKQMVVGYKLIDAQGTEVQVWGGAWGQCPGIPNPLRLPNGDHVHAPALDTDYSGFTLVPWTMMGPENAVPESITRRQCALQLLALGLITGSEAVAMTRDGTPPATIQAYFNSLPEEERVMAEIDFAATSYYRSNSRLNAILSLNNMQEEDADAFFVAAGDL